MDYPLRLVDQLRAHLRGLRKQRGLTQVQLGRLLGLSQVRIAEIEAKPGLVSTDQLIKVLSALGATVILRDHAEDAETPKPTYVLRDPSPAHPTSPRAAAKQAQRRPTAASKRNSAPTQASIIKPKKGSW